MRGFVFAGAIVAASTLATWSAGAQDKGLTVDGDGNVVITGDLTVGGNLRTNGTLTVMGSITATRGMTAAGPIYGGVISTAGDISTQGAMSAKGAISAGGQISTSSGITATETIKTDEYFAKYFPGSGTYHLDSSGPFYAAYWYKGESASQVSMGEPKAVAKGLELVNGMKGMSYSITLGDLVGGQRDYRLTPDGIEKLLPDIAVKDRAGHAWIDERQAVAFLVEAVKEQQKLIEALQNEITSIRSRLTQR